MKRLRVLVGCEYSGTVRNAFLDRGHDAWSCDLLDTEQPGPHITGDVLEILHEGWDLAIFHPECFGKDAIVLTREGYKSIADVKRGDFVLTHKGRYRMVTDVTTQWAQETIEVQGTSLIPVTTTAEHPFLVREKTVARNVRSFGSEQWKEAGKLNKNDFLCLVLPEVDPSAGAEFSDDLLWLMGRYVADGVIRDSRFTEGKYESLTICVGKGKEEAFLERVSWRKNSPCRKPTCLLVDFYGSDFVKKFAQFGRGAENKTLPNWVLALPVDRAKCFLDGYLSGDGCFTDRFTSCQTVSKALAIGVGILMLRVHGACPSIRIAEKAGNCTIEGRSCKTREAYSAISYKPGCRKKNFIGTNGSGWSPFRSSRSSEAQFVYNLSVDEDESYTVNGIAVHNCTYLTIAAEWAYGPGPYHQKVKPETLTGEARQQARREAIAFVKKLWAAPIDKIAIENPIGVLSREIGKPQQIIQPHQFGHDASKATCLWLKNLPQVIPSDRVAPRLVQDKNGKLRERWANQCDSGQNKLTPSADRWKDRARTYSGIAKAMAELWG